jgi:hypothetical protein
MKLIFFSFPQPAAAVFHHSDCVLFLFSPALLTPCPLSWDKKEFEKPDQILPRLLQVALSCHPIHCCITFKGPGPYTAVRTMQSLLQGLCAGRPHLLCSSLSLTPFEQKLQQKTDLPTCYQILCDMNQLDHDPENS